MHKYRGLVGNAAARRQHCFQIEVPRILVADDIALIIHNRPTANDNHHAWIAERFSNFLQSIRHKVVVGVEPRQHLTRRAFPAAHNGIGLPFVRFANPVRDLIRILLMISTLPSVEPPSKTKYSTSTFG